MTKNEWIKILWINTHIGGRYFSKAAMYVPFKIDKIEGDYYAQLDTGADRTILYGNAIINLISADNLLSGNIDYSDRKNKFPVDHFWLRKIAFSIGQYQFRNKDVVVYNNFGSWDGIESGDNFKEIGTVGTEILKNKVLVIDFPNDRLKLLNHLTKDSQISYTAQNMEFIDGKPIITLMIEEQEYKFIYDTGSSIFPAIVTKKLFDNLAGVNSKIEKINGIKAWDKKVSAMGKEISSSISFENIPFANRRVYSIGYDAAENYFAKIGVAGIVGNRHFLDKKIFIDFKKASFGIETNN